MAWSKFFLEIKCEIEYELLPEHGEKPEMAAEGVEFFIALHS